MRRSRVAKLCAWIVPIIADCFLICAASFEAGDQLAKTVCGEFDNLTFKSPALKQSAALRMNFMTMSREEDLRPVLSNAPLRSSQGCQLGTFDVHLYVIGWQNPSLFQEGIEGCGLHFNCTAMRKVAHRTGGLDLETRRAILAGNRDVKDFDVLDVVERKVSIQILKIFGEGLEGKYFSGADQPRS